MVEVTIDSIRVSLMSQHRVVILKDVDSDRYLPIWIGPFEADAITIVLQEQEVPRPLTHDLLKNVIYQLGGTVEQIVISELKNEVFYARIIIEVNGRTLEIDSRPSDAIALAVRARVPIYIEESVMEKAAVQPEAEVESEEGGSGRQAESDEKLDAFREFLDTLDLDDLEGGKDKDKGDD
ncbi:MAG: bifunctional nuclease family protein [Anaerolineales bacterium]|nr:bifunctional nuclease family protein [Anaerolineales bacterium]